MRRALIVVVFAALMLVGATKQPPTAALGAQTVEQRPQEPGVTEISPTMLRFLEWAVTQGGLTIVLLFVLAGYRRDFFRKVENLERQVANEREEKRLLREVLDKNAIANTAHAVAVAQNTDATKALAASVDRFAERRVIQRRDGEAS